MALSEDTMSKCSEHLSAYKSACEDHPDLKSFDSSLQQRTNKVIDSLTAEAEKRNNKMIDLLTVKAEKQPNKVIDSLTAETETGLLLSQHAVHMEVSKHLHEVSQGVADFIVKSEDDVWENKAIRSLVEAYFDSTMKTLKILDNVEDCVDKAKKGQRFIQQAVARFNKESAENDVGGKKKNYKKTLDKLKKFKDIGDPFGELKTQFELVQKQQESLLDEVSEARKKLQEEYDSLHKVSVISNAVFGAAFFLVAVASIAASLLTSGVAAAALGLVLPAIATVWAGVHASLAKRMDALKRQEEALNELQNKLESVGLATEINQNAMESVSEQVYRLEKKILSILETVDEALVDEQDETDISIDLKSISDTVEELTDGIKEVGKEVSRSRKLIIEARYHVMEKIKGSA